jgi:hypothetical protein
VLTPWSLIQNQLLRYASNLRFPRLLAVAAVLFVIDLLIPDPLPLLDEILLGLISLLLASLKKQGGEMSGRQGSRIAY